jgi:hypothetical protein
VNGEIAGEGANLSSPGWRGEASGGLARGREGGPRWHVLASESEDEQERGVRFSHTHRTQEGLNTEAWGSSEFHIFTTSLISISPITPKNYYDLSILSDKVGSY